MPKAMTERVLPKGPCLQELVARHGGYDKITREAWAKYDHAMKRYRFLMALNALDEY